MTTYDKKEICTFLETFRISILDNEACVGSTDKSRPHPQTLDRWVNERKLEDSDFWYKLVNVKTGTYENKKGLLVLVNPEDKFKVYHKDTVHSAVELALIDHYGTEFSVEDLILADLPYFGCEDKAVTFLESDFKATFKRVNSDNLPYTLSASDGGNEIGMVFFNIEDKWGKDFDCPDPDEYFKSQKNASAFFSIAEKMFNFPVKEVTLGASHSSYRRHIVYVPLSPSLSRLMEFKDQVYLCTSIYK